MLNGSEASRNARYQSGTKSGGPGLSLPPIAAGASSAANAYDQCAVSLRERFDRGRQAQLGSVADARSVTTSSPGALMARIKPESAPSQPSGRVATGVSSTVTPLAPRRTRRGGALFYGGTGGRAGSNSGPTSCSRRSDAPRRRHQSPGGIRVNVRSSPLVDFDVGALSKRLLEAFGGALADLTFGRREHELSRRCRPPRRLGAPRRRGSAPCQSPLAKPQDGAGRQRRRWTSLLVRRRGVGEVRVVAGEEGPDVRERVDCVLRIVRGAPSRYPPNDDGDSAVADGTKRPAPARLSRLVTATARSGALARRGWPSLWWKGWTTTASLTSRCGRRA